jgi:hypothetical protein
MKLQHNFAWPPAIGIANSCMSHPTSSAEDTLNDSWSSELHGANARPSSYGLRTQYTFQAFSRCRFALPTVLFLTAVSLVARYFVGNDPRRTLSSLRQDSRARDEHGPSSSESSEEKPYWHRPYFGSTRLSGNFSASAGQNF